MRLFLLILSTFLINNLLIAQTSIVLKKEAGVYVVPCVVNGLNLKFIFDTGASDVSISMIEAAYMLKNGLLHAEDIIGKSKYQTAEGTISEGTSIILREINIAGLKLKDVKATVVKNLDAPLLLGMSAISKLGKIQLDTRANKLTIYPEQQASMIQSISAAPHKTHSNQQCQSESNKQIKWVSFKEVQELQKSQKRKVLVDIYTDWCGWCKRMDASTFQDPRIIKYLNKNYYAVKFNAEQKDEIHFKSQIFKFIPSGNRGVHQLAIEITNGQLSYPTFVFMDEDLNTIQPVPGYLDAETFELISNYFGGNHYKTTPYESFQDKFKATMIKR